MTQDKHLSDELAVHRRRLVLVLKQHDHALPDVLAADLLQRERRGLSRTARRDGDAFALYRSDGRRCELPQTVRADDDVVACVDDAGLDDAADDGADEGDGESVVDVEFEGGVDVVFAVVRDDVEEGAD